MSDIKVKYGTNNQPVVINLVNLAASQLNNIMTSDYVDNTVNLFDDVLIGGKITAGNAPVSSGVIGIYAYGTVDGGTIYTAGASGIGGLLRISGCEVMTLKLVDLIPVDTASGKAYEFGPVCLSSAFRGIIPARWGIAVHNDTGFNLYATGHNINYQGIHLQIV